MVFTVGTEEDVSRMVSSDAPEGSFLFRPAKEPKWLTLCVKRGAIHKKYRFNEVDEGEGTSTAYIWKNETTPGADGAKEKFSSLNDIVQRKRRVFHLIKDFLSGQSLKEEEPDEVNTGAGEEDDIYGELDGDDVSEEKSFPFVGTTEDEERMKKASPCKGTFLVRPSQGDRYTMCIMNKNSAGKLVLRKHQIQTAPGKNGEKSYSLVNRTRGPDKSADAGGEETFPSLEELVRCKWELFELQRNFLGNRSFSDLFGDGDAERNREHETAKSEEVLSVAEVCIKL